MEDNFFVLISVYLPCGCCSESDYFSGHAENPLDMEEIKNILENLSEYSNFQSITQVTDWVLPYKNGNEQYKAFYYAIVDYTTEED